MKLTKTPAEDRIAELRRLATKHNLVVVQRGNQDKFAIKHFWQDKKIHNAKYVSLADAELILDEFIAYMAFARSL